MKTLIILNFVTRELWKFNFNKENFGKENFGKVLNFAEVEKLKNVLNFAEVEKVIICFYEVLVMIFDSIFLNFFIFCVLRFLQNEKQTVEK